MNIGMFLMTSLLNGLVALALLPLAALATVLVLKIIVELTPWKMKNVFDKGISGGTIIVATVLFGICLILAAAAL